MSKFLEQCKKLSSFLLLILTFFLFDVSTVFAHTPHDVISKLEISSSYEQDKTLLIIVRNNLLRSEDGGYSWKRIVKGLDNRHLLSPWLFLMIIQINFYFYHQTEMAYTSHRIKVTHGLKLTMDLVA